MSSILDALKKLEAEKAESARPAARVFQSLPPEQQLTGRKPAQGRSVRPYALIAIGALGAVLLVTVSVGASLFFMKGAGRPEQVANLPAVVPQPPIAPATAVEQTHPAEAAPIVEAKPAAEPAGHTPALEAAAEPPQNKPTPEPVPKPAVLPAEIKPADERKLAQYPAPVLEKKPQPKAEVVAEPMPPPQPKPLPDPALEAKAPTEPTPNVKPAPEPIPQPNPALQTKAPTEPSPNVIPAAQPMPPGEPKPEPKPVADAKPAAEPVPLPKPAPVVQPPPTPAPTVSRPIIVAKAELTPAPVAQPVAPAPVLRRPVNVSMLPPLRNSDKPRYGLEGVQLNMLRPASKNRPYASAIINLQPVEIGELIPGTTAVLIAVEKDAVAIQIQDTGERFQMRF